MIDYTHLSKLTQRVLVGLFFALSRDSFIGVNKLLGRPTKRLNECSLLFGMMEVVPTESTTSGSEGPHNIAVAPRKSDYQDLLISNDAESRYFVFARV